ncbi:hypothetical protein BH11BAC3_BH11BAC3_37150 [soil metagenome]
MKKIILVTGLIGGTIVSIMLIYATWHITQTDDFEGNMFLGYATMILAFSLIFVAVKQVRDKENNGVISFGKAFKTGLFVTLVTSTMYVLVWLVCYYFFTPDFMDKYTACVLKNATRDGATAAEMTEKVAEMKSYREMYKNPLFVILLTYMEILPVGLIVSLITALILKRKINKDFGVLAEVRA